MTDAAQVRQLWPLLRVNDLELSIAFWTEKLGFSLTREAVDAGRRFWCQLERGGASIMLESRDEPRTTEESCPVTFYFVVDDARLMHKEVVARGLAVQDPEAAYYGMLQLHVPCPDGYEVVFESPMENWNQ